MCSSISLPLIADRTSLGGWQKHGHWEFGNPTRRRRFFQSSKICNLKKALWLSWFGSHGHLCGQNVSQNRVRGLMHQVQLAITVHKWKVRLFPSCELGIPHNFRMWRILSKCPHFLITHQPLHYVPIANSGSTMRHTTVTNPGHPFHALSVMCHQKPLFILK